MHVPNSVKAVFPIAPNEFLLEVRDYLQQRGLHFIQIFLRIRHFTKMPRNALGMSTILRPTPVRVSCEKHSHYICLPLHSVKAKELEVLAEAVRTENHRKRALEAQKGYIIYTLALNIIHNRLIPGVSHRSQLMRTSLRISSNGIQMELTGTVSQKRYFRG